MKNKSLHATRLLGRKVGHPKCRRQQRLARNCQRLCIGYLGSGRQSKELLEHPMIMNWLDPLNKFDIFCLWFYYFSQIKDILKENIAWLNCKYLILGFGGKFFWKYSLLFNNCQFIFFECLYQIDVAFIFYVFKNIANKNISIIIL